MSEREEHETKDRDGQEESHVDGVDMDPGDGNKSIEVDTSERLAHKDDEPDFDDISEDDLEQERQERLDPDNRPDNTEIDNSKRTFDPETGLFEDSEVEPPEEAPFATTDAEQSNQGSSEDDEPADSEQSDSADDSEDADESADAEEPEKAER